MKRLAIISILLLALPCWSAQIIRYVDTGVSDVIPGTVNDGTSWATAYQSLDEWDTHEQTDLDTANNYMTVYLRASTGAADPNYVDLQAGWATSATDYIEIIQDDTPTDGVFDATKYRMTSSSGVDTLAVRRGWVYVIGVQFVFSQSGITAANALYIADMAASSTVYIDSCIIHYNGTTSGAIYGIYTSVNGAAAYIYNCTIYGEQAGYGIWAALGTTAVYNCTLYDWGQGIHDQLAYLVIKNCAIGLCGDDINGGDVIDYNLTNDNTGTNSQIPLSQDWDNEFTDANNSDFHLVAGGNCIGNGTDVPDAGAFYNDDIRGVLRTSTWDIGAYEVGDDPGGSSGINDWWWRRRHNN